MRIVHVGAGMIPIPPPGYGAVEKHIWNLTQAQERLGHDVTIVNEVVGTRSADEYRFALRARRRLRAMRYDVLHVHTPGVAAVFSALGPRNFVFTTHTRHWATTEGLGERVGFELEKIAVRRAREVIAISHFVEERMAGLRRPHVIPYGIDVAKYAPSADKRPFKAHVVGVGVVAPHKNWHVAAEAVKGTPWHLTVAGPFTDPDYAERVRDAAPGQVTLPGSLDEPDVVKLLQDADVLIHPSLSDSFGLAILEGMSCGLPLLGSDIVSGLVTPEVGFMVTTKQSDDAQAAAYREHLERLRADDALRERLAAASRARTLREFTWDAVARRVLDVYGRP